MGGGAGTDCRVSEDVIVAFCESWLTDSCQRLCTFASMVVEILKVAVAYITLLSFVSKDSNIDGARSASSHLL